MDRLDRLWAIAEQMQIFVRFVDLQFKNPGLLGLYFTDYGDGLPVIMLDETLHQRRRMLKCVLAEEIGHHITAPRQNIRQVHGAYRRYGECNETIVMAQDERNALRWATDFLMPDVELCRALSEGYRSCFELSEYFEVTEWMVYRKLGLMNACFRRTGLKVKGRELFNIQMQETPCKEGASCAGIFVKEAEFTT